MFGLQWGVRDGKKMRTERNRTCVRRKDHQGGQSQHQERREAGDRVDEETGRTQQTRPAARGLSDALSDRHGARIVSEKYRFSYRAQLVSTAESMKAGFHWRRKQKHK